jgi:hemoglobin
MVATGESNETRGTSLFQRVGGGPAVKAVVEDFYVRIRDDERLDPFFKGVDMAILKKHQYMFMEIAFTHIPDDLDVAEMMKTKHQRLFAMGLNETHFDMVTGHLVGSMNALSVSRNLIDEAAGVVAPLRGVFEEGAKQAAYTKEVQEHIAEVAHAPVQEKETAKGDQHTDTLFNRLGGGPAVRAVVAEFYDRMVVDAQLARFFEGVDISVLKKHQFAVMQLAFTDSLHDIDVPAMMIEKHQRLFGMGMNEIHFDMVAGFLVLSMEHLGVSKQMIDEAVAIIGPLRGAFEKGAADYKLAQEKKPTEEKKDNAGYWEE